MHLQQHRPNQHCLCLTVTGGKRSRELCHAAGFIVVAVAAASLLQNGLTVAIILLTGISLAGWKLNRPLRESIMVISGLAVVLETHTVCGLGSSAVLDAALIQDVIINEVIQSGLLSVGSQLLARNEQRIELIGCLAVTTSKAFFYIAFILSGQRKMAVGFRRMRPRLHMLQPAYRALLKELELPGADQAPG